MEVFAIVTALWVFSVCLHEFGHALAAYCGGDHTVVQKGYLTLNPLRYTHPVYSIVMPVVFVMMGGIGLPGGAVYIERHRLRSRGWDSAVSLAGPLMTLIVVLLISLLFKCGIISQDPENKVSMALAFLLQLEISSVLLNLAPVPPLDGFQAIAPWLPGKVRDHPFAKSEAGTWILFLALWYIPSFNEGFWNLIWFISSALGVEPYLGYSGWEAFRFWEE